MSRKGSPVRTIDIKSDRPPVQEALSRLDRELKSARQQRDSLLKIIHGYGSTGAGGDIRIAVQKRLRELTGVGEIRGCIFGENWSKTDEAAWALLKQSPELKSDPHLGKGNRGITVVIL